MRLVSLCLGPPRRALPRDLVAEGEVERTTVEVLVGWERQVEEVTKTTKTMKKMRLLAREQGKAGRSVDERGV